MPFQPPPCPPLDNSLDVLPGFVDFHATHNPERPLFLFPEADGVSFKEFADATHRVAHALRPNRAGLEGQVVAMVIHCDTLLYDAVMIGAIRAGLIPFPMSPRNSAAAIAKMIEGTNCHRVIHHTPFHPLTEAVRAALPQGYDLQAHELIPLGDAFPRFGAGQTDVVPFPPPKQPAQDDDVVLYIHSSGSTGFPKPIPQTRLSVFHWSISAVMIDTRERGLRWGSPALPPFHTMGVCIQLYCPLVSGQPCTLYAPRAHLGMPPPVPTAQNVLDACRKTNVNAIATVPSFVEEWAQHQEEVTYMANLDVVIFAGGPLSQHNGDKLSAAGVKIYAAYGATEFGPTTRILDCVDDAPNNPEIVRLGKTRKDWQWMAFPESYNIRWEPQSDGTFELIFLDCPTHHPSVFNLKNGEKGYATSDLWERHPTKPSLYRIAGRSDDVLVLGNGEKIVPIGQEGHVTAHPMVMGAVMFGRGKEQPGLLVEPRPQYAIPSGDEEALAKFRNTIWAQVEEANQPAPGFAKIFKEMILVTDPARPLPRAPKGTVQRKQALALYETEIEQLYETIANSSDARGVSPPSEWTALEVQAWLSEHAAQLNQGIVLPPTADLFAHGFDSLSATFFRNRIIGGLRSSSDAAASTAAQHVSSSFIFKHPSIAELAAAIIALVHPSSEAAPSAQEPIADIEAFIAKYTALLPASAPSGASKKTDGAVIVVTGTTGALGAHLIAYLLGDERVKKVYALNRGTKLVERQLDAFEAALLPVGLVSHSKLVLLEGDIMREDLGLKASDLSEIRSTVTDFIHNAWRVDFNLSLASFEPHVAASIRLATLVPGARFFFTSSVSSAFGWRALKSGPVPEEPLHDPAVAVGLGYGASKYVVEEVIANAREKGIATTTFRIGQVAGSTESGAWNTAEWVPSLVKSSTSLGALPQLQGEVEWIPMDAVAHTAIDVVLGGEAPSCINIVHPRPVAAAEIIDNLNEALGLKLPVVPLSQWVECLESAAKNASAKDLETTPAIKLIDFFRGLAATESATKAGKLSAGGADGMPSFQTQKAQTVSETMARLPPLGKREVSKWVAYWKNQKFLA